MTSEATVQRTACAVVVHLAAHRGAAQQVRRWGERLGGTDGGTAAPKFTPRTSEEALRAAVPGHDWRSDRGRGALREHLASPDPTLFSTAVLLGPAYRHTGGPLHVDAPAGIDALGAALRGRPARVHLTIGDHAGTAVLAWVDAVRRGHLVRFSEFARSLVEPSWVPLTEHLVATFGADRVVVHDATRARPDDQAATDVVVRGLLDAVLADLGTPSTHAVVPPADRDPEHWSARQVEVALAMLPHLRSWADRAAMRTFVQTEIDVDGVPVRPVDEALAEQLARRDAADLAVLDTLVEVR
jgi:hypothetical protein